MVGYNNTQQYEPVTLWLFGWFWTDQSSWGGGGNCIVELGDDGVGNQTTNKLRYIELRIDQNKRRKEPKNHT